MAPLRTVEPTVNQCRALGSHYFHLLNRNVYFPFHLVDCLEMDGVVHPDHVAQSLTSVIRQHDSLQMGFRLARNFTPDAWARMLSESAKSTDGDGLFVATLHSETQAYLTHECLDERDLSPTSPVLWALIARHYNRPFELLTPPLVRAVVINGGRKRSLLVLIVHHLVADLWSQLILRRHFVAQLQGRPASDQRLAGNTQQFQQYSDYCKRQADGLRDGAFAASIAYWSEQWRRAERWQLQYKDFPFCLPPRPNVRTNCCNIVLELELTRALRDSARKSAVTLASTLISIVIVALHKCTGRPVIPVWINLSNRAAAPRSNSIGWFAHSHLLAFDVLASMTYNEVVLNTQSVLGKALLHQDVAELSVWRALGRLPWLSDLRIIVDVLGEDQQLGQRQFGAMGGLNVGRFRIQGLRKLGAPGGIDIVAIDRQDGLSITVTFSEGRFTEAAMSYVLAKIREAALNLVSNPYADVE